MQRECCFSIRAFLCLWQILSATVTCEPSGSRDMRSLHIAIDTSLRGIKTIQTVSQVLFYCDLRSFVFFSTVKLGIIRDIGIIPLQTFHITKKKSN